MFVLNGNGKKVLTAMERLGFGNIVSNVSPLARKYERRRIRIFEPSYGRG